MESLKLCLVLLTFIVAASTLEKARYDNYRVYKFTVEDKQQNELLKAIENNPDGYRLMSGNSFVIGSNVQLVVPPHKFAEFSELEAKFNLKAEIVSMNLQEAIDKEAMMSSRRKATFDWTGYWTLDEINEWLDSLVVEHPGDVSIFNVGTSYEGREIRGVKVNFGGGEKKTIFVEATIHAYEWIATTTATYVLNEILTSEDTDIRSLADRYEWYFLIVFNVDGYAYTWEVDRMWRKTRRPTRSALCHGADPNRNFDIHWNEHFTSEIPCNINYAGDFVFSEPETQQHAEFMATVPRLAGYFSFHSYGQFIMIPRGYTNEPLENYDDLYEIAFKGGQSLTEATGAVYQVGPVGNFYGLVSGTSTDYITENFKPNMTFTYELRPTRMNDNDGLGKIVSPDQIASVGQEVFASFVTILQEAIKKDIA